ncbi:Universal stress protein family protein [Raineyella antarctica]|uniref:Universal stress protein family protein n=1 Tax=Raineyella antarctica TaxID=1577474 RepID=A0A1G6GQZ3_9ACTN|nr:universal stress protein [Raineyella antarctica]SDB84155.1 Universal stress protein family protein [Raineyella antarctica]
MCTVVAYSSSAESRAALTFAIERVRRSGSVLHVVSREPAVPPEIEERLSEVTWEWEYCEPESDLASRVLQAAVPPEGEVWGDPAIVIGLRRRTAEGRLSLGQTAERVLLEASCPVVTVKCA